MASQSEFLPRSSRRHSLNQEVVKHRRDMGKKGNSPKAEKSERRKRREDQFVRDWIRKQSELNLWPEKRFKLALKRGNDEDIQLLFNNDDDFEAFGRRVDRFTFPMICPPVERIEEIGEKAAELLTRKDI